MFQRRKYKNPPLIEALCEVSFSETQSNVTFFGKFEDKVKSDYPKQKQLRNVGLEVNFASEIVHTKQVDQVPMMRFSKEDTSQLVQITENLLTFNKLKYLGYENFKGEFQKVLDTYLELAKPKYFERIGVRYLNKILIPEENFHLDDYFNFSLNFSNQEFSSINGVSFTVQLTPKHSSHQLLITLRSIISTEEGKSEFLLDMYDTIELQKEIDKDFIIKTLDEAHENVEYLFEGVITDKSREIFEVEQ